MNIEPKDILIVRQTAMKAAAEVWAARAEDAVDQVAVDVCFLAREFEEHMLREAGFTDSLVALQDGPQPTPIRKNGHQGFDVCPEHPDRVKDSKYGNFYCPGCEHGWEQKDFTNKEKDGSKTVVTKVKWDGKWYDERQFAEVV